MLKPNTMYRTGHLEISCYGEKLIMVEHPQLDAPLPIGPTDSEAFWTKPDGERLLSVLTYLGKRIDWVESSPNTLMWLGADIADARQELEEGSDS